MRYFEVKITNQGLPGSHTLTEGPFKIYYVLNGVRTVATRYDNDLPAENLTLSELQGGVLVYFPDNASELILVDEGTCNKETIYQINSDCPVIILTASGILQYYTPFYDVIFEIEEQLGFNVVDFAISENRMWVLDSSHMLYEYFITTEPFSYILLGIYGIISNILAITAIDDDKLYGFGFNPSNFDPAFYEITPSFSGINLSSPTYTNPDSLIHHEAHYNPDRNIFVTLGRDYGVSGWPFYIVEYNMSGNITDSINFTAQIPNETPEILYSYSGELYVITFQNKVYLINRDNSTLEYIKTLPDLPGSFVSGKQYKNCRSIYLDLQNVFL